MKLTQILKETNIKRILSESNYRDKKFFLSNLSRAIKPTGILNKLFATLKKGDYYVKSIIDKNDDWQGDIYYYKNTPVLGIWGDYDAFIELTWLTDKDANNSELADRVYEKFPKWIFNYLIKNKIGQ